MKALSAITASVFVLTTGCTETKAPPPPPPPTPEAPPPPIAFPSPSESFEVNVPVATGPTRDVAAGVAVFADAKGMRIAGRNLASPSNWNPAIDVVPLRDDLAIPIEFLPSPILAAPLQAKLRTLLATDRDEALGGRVAVFADPAAPIQLIYQSVNTAAHTGLRNHDLVVRTSQQTFAALHAYVPVMGTCRNPVPRCIQAGIALTSRGHLLQVREAPQEAPCRTYTRVKPIDEAPLPSLDPAGVTAALGNTQAPPANSEPCKEAFITTPPVIPWGDVVNAVSALAVALKVPSTLGPPLQKPPKSTEILQGLKEMRRVPLVPERGQGEPQSPPQ